MVNTPEQQPEKQPEIIEATLISTESGTIVETVSESEETGLTIEIEIIEMKE